MMEPNIVSMMVDKPRRARDEYGLGRETTRRAMILDYVVGRRAESSESLLLQLPNTILTDVVDMLGDDKPTLASLALVNSTCYLLARSSQFVDFEFDYSPRSKALMKSLRGMLISSGVNQLPPPTASTISSCVRKFTMASSPKSLRFSHDKLYVASSSRIAPPEPIMRHLVQRANKRLIAHAMPNLRVICWKDKFPVNERFFQYLMMSPARRVELQKLARKLDTFPPWSVESSERDVQEQEESLDRVHEGLLRHCAPTLRSLKLRDQPIVFPHLSSLQLSRTVRFSYSALSTFLSAPLRHLGFPSCHRSHHAKALADSEPLRNLETLIIPYLPMVEEDAAHIKTLYVHERQRASDDTAHLNSVIIPVLSPKQFTNLKSLSLGWGGWITSPVAELPTVRVSEDALRAIGTLTSLEQLSLRAGVEQGEIRAAFRELKRLKKLAISRDTYPVSIHHPNAADDYVMANAYPEVDELIGGELVEPSSNSPHDSLVAFLRHEAWERSHRNKMIREAEMYTAVLPALEWIYLGQRPMAILGEPDDLGRRTVLPLTRCRDNCFTYLEQTFVLNAFEFE
ncbi:hypothetical protein F4776DRAFT_676410 [Hypoxylon sp. NC0597]|nr:hypothetical protein F4776DRAFT_676410 [Hypoxylon sp. NC0597]